MKGVFTARTSQSYLEKKGDFEEADDAYEDGWYLHKPLYLWFKT